MILRIQMDSKNSVVQMINRSRWLLLTWPNVGRNLLGWLFIGAGALVSLTLVGTPMLAFCKGLGLEGPLAAFPGLILIMAGAWLGAGTYTFLFCRSGNQSIIPCPKCSQKLRLPSAKGQIRITCPSCRHQFNSSVNS